MCPVCLCMLVISLIDELQKHEIFLQILNTKILCQIFESSEDDGHLYAIILGTTTRFFLTWICCQKALIVLRCSPEDSSRQLLVKIS